MALCKYHHAADPRRRSGKLSSEMGLAAGYEILRLGPDVSLKMALKTTNNGYQTTGT